jgi:hypothetical protein
MDKLYKAHFLSQLKARMPTALPDFEPHKTPPAGHPLRGRFAGSKLYVKRNSPTRCLWLEWFPADGVEREFFAFLGWSPAADVLPTNAPGDHRVYGLRGPVADMPFGAINVQQAEGRQAIRGFVIATPWDQLYELSPRVPDAERKRVMHKAHAEYLALTDAERIEAVRGAMDEAFKCIHGVLPLFASQLEQQPGDVQGFAHTD